ncbi:hypothetical protein M0805_000467 [Coniferiporia weirii]|nr:hypothetical protein M0805_000467 [Coniferiporia weirii]
MYRVFLKAPTTADLKRKNTDDTPHWQTASRSSLAKVQRQNSKSLLQRSGGHLENPSIQEEAASEDEGERILPPATIDAASQRISEMYKNVIFIDEEEEEDWATRDRDEQSNWDDMRSKDVSKRGSLISWPPTDPEQTRSRVSFAPPQALSRANINTQLETQENSVSVSYAHTSTSSIAAFPTFVINLHTLTPLSALLSAVSTAINSGSSVPAKWSKKVQLLVAVLEVDGPDAVVIKKGPDAGKEVGVLKLVVGDENGAVCKLTAWREVADLWGGVKESETTLDEISDGVQRGDIVYLENVIASPPPIAKASDQRAAPFVALTASPNLLSRLHICYRTLPSVSSDRRFRPDLRLAASDPGLRKVAGVVNWLQDSVGLDC